MTKTVDISEMKSRCGKQERRHVCDRHDGMETDLPAMKKVLSPISETNTREKACYYACE